MSNHFNSSFELITPERKQQLQQEKSEAREKLLDLLPEKAQNQVNSILFPEHWQLSTETISWDESLPTFDGEINP